MTGQLSSFVHQWNLTRCAILLALMAMSGCDLFMGANGNTDGGDMVNQADGGEQTDAGPTNEDPNIWVGTGYEQFEHIGAGDNLDLHQGFQGCCHVFGSMRASDIDPIAVHVDFKIENNNNPIAHTILTTDFSPVPGNEQTFELLGLMLILETFIDVTNLPNEWYVTLSITPQGEETRSLRIPVKPYCGETCELGVDGNEPDGGSPVNPNSTDLRIGGISASSMTVSPGETLTLTSLAYSISDLPIVYEWSASDGQLSQPTEASTEWTAPVVETTTQIVLQASTSLESVQGSMEIHVEE